jgi:Ca2+-binding EF-hand superfamily protein
MTEPAQFARFSWSHAILPLLAAVAVMWMAIPQLQAEIPGVDALDSLIGEQFDTNADGEIDTDEWNTGIADGFDTLDADGSGDVEAAEIDELGDPIREQFGDFGGALVVALVKAIVLTLDTDKNKIVSREEYTRETEKFLNRLDVDGNGSVSEAELRSLPSKVLAKEKN